MHLYSELEITRSAVLKALLMDRISVTVTGSGIPKPKFMPRHTLVRRSIHSAWLRPARLKLTTSP